MKAHSGQERVCNIEIQISRVKSQIKRIRKSVDKRIRKAGPQLASDFTTHAKWIGKR